MMKLRDIGRRCERDCEGISTEGRVDALLSTSGQGGAVPGTGLKLQTHTTKRKPEEIGRPEMGARELRRGSERIRGDRLY
jgi:hypothetical protein